MRFGPNPGRIGQPDAGLFQTRDMLQTQCHEFARFQFRSDPLSSALVPPLTTATLVERGFGANAARNVARRSEACGASVGRVGVYGNSTQTAQDRRKLRGRSSCRCGRDLHVDIGGVCLDGKVKDADLL